MKTENIPGTLVNGSGMLHIRDGITLRHGQGTGDINQGHFDFTLAGPIKVMMTFNIK